MFIQHTHTTLGGKWEGGGSLAAAITPEEWIWTRQRGESSSLRPHKKVPGTASGRGKTRPEKKERREKDGEDVEAAAANLHIRWRLVLVQP